MRIYTEDKRFIDEEGRQRIFNGINLCDKGRAEAGEERRIYSLDFNEDLIKAFAENGFNLIRLGLTWDAVEPEPRYYNEEYLDRVEKIADLCEKYGIYFYLDMHQDLFSGKKETAGDGAPSWACLTHGAKFRKTRFVWAEGYFWGKAVHRAFDSFWYNEEYNGIPLQTYFCDMWKHVAERFADHPALFGFDLFNEPFPGSDGGKVFRKLVSGIIKTVITDKRCNVPVLLGNIISGKIIKCLEPFNDYSLFRKITSNADGLIRKFDTGVYSEFLNRTASAIREVTDNGIIMMENSYYSNLGIPYSTPAVTVNGKREEKLCFAPHAYDLMVDTPAYKYASNTRVGGIFDEHRISQLKLNVPVIVGEWGGQSEGTEWLYHIDFLLRKFDSYHWGQTYWCYYEGLLENPVMTCLRRTFPRAVSGKIDSYNWDKDNKVFTLNYTQDKNYSAPTEIYLHKEPIKIVCDGKYKVSGSILSIETKPGTHSVTVSF
ncbi:MAG: cellulase family glycosylhydrolase [Clostridia bacterium]|nr:cellulase family glycosylhydrolase [Clostridia bacterium]